MTDPAGPGPAGTDPPTTEAPATDPSSGSGPGEPRPAAAAGRSPLASPRAAALWAAAVAALVFANSLGNGFAYDDVLIIVENGALQSLETLPRALLEPYWPGGRGLDLGLWRPGATAAFGLQWAAWGDAPALFHLVNLLAHAGVTALVVLLLAGLAPLPVAFTAGLLFAVHPVHVEAVANVVGFAELLSAALYLSACLLHLRAPRARYGGGRLLAVLACYVAAFLTKEGAVTLPAALFLLDAARERLAPRDLGAYLRRRWSVYAALAAAAAAVLACRVWVLGSVASPLPPLGADLLEQGVPRVWTLAQIWAHYARLLVFPVDLSADYAPDMIPIALGWTGLGLAGVALALGALGLALWAWRGRPLDDVSDSRRLLGFGVVWFLVTIAPVSNVAFLSGVLLAERTLYLPSVGFAAMAGWGLVLLWRARGRVALGLAALVLVLLAVRTWERTPTWRDTSTVFTTMLAESPESGRSQWVLADMLLEQGRVSEALRTYRVAVRRLGGDYQLLTGIGRRLMDAGRHETAIRLLETAWREYPDLHHAPGYLAVALYQRQLWPDAARFARAAYAQEPDALMAHIAAESLARGGDLDQAVPWRQRAIALGEGEHWQQWMWLAGLHLALGDSARAEAARDSALTRVTTPAEREAVASWYEPFRPPPAPLQDSTESQDARPEAPEGAS